MSHQTPFSFFKQTLSEEFKWVFLNSVFYGGGTVSMLFIVDTLGNIIDHVSKTPNEIPYGSIIWLVVLLLSYEYCYRVGHTVEMTLASRIRKKIKTSLLQYTIRLQYGYFVDRFAGGIAHRISTITDAYESIVKIVTNNFIDNIVMVVSGIMLLFFVHWSLGLGLFIWTILFLTGVIPLATRVNRYADEHAEEEVNTTGKFVDTYTNIGTVKVYGDVENQKGRLAEQIEREFQAFRRLGWQDILLYHYHGISGIIVTGGLIIGSYSLFLHGQLTIGELVFTLGFALRVFGTVWDIGPAIANYNRHYGECVQGLSDIFVPATLSDPKDGKILSSARSLSISYNSVDFSYLPGKSILKGFSLHIPAGQRVGIVGTSGSGKTTLINLLLRFYDVTEGKILVDETDIRDLTQEHLRSKIAHVSQDTTLFHQSILENIRYSRPDATREELETASKMAHAHEFIVSLQNGYDTMVGDRGVKLSGGQRQRIAIARAILKDAPIFLLDEATSALDSESEKKVQSALHDLMDGRTVIAVAHRLSTLLSMDRIIVVHQGRIVEDGSHERLLEKNGIYKKLWDLQVGGFIPETEGLGVGNNQIPAFMGMTFEASVLTLNS